MASKAPPDEVALIRRAIRDLLQKADPTGIPIGKQFGVYAFFDYDGEPIYVGRTIESLSTRIGRHLTGRRSDAVGKFILDPFEVLEVEVWPMGRLESLTKVERKAQVAAVEYAVFQKALSESKFHAVLNEGTIAPAPPTVLPSSYRDRIIPDELYRDRRHPDVRIARRAQTIASLARLISERSVKKGARVTLLVQSQRLESLARKRLEDFADEEVAVDEETVDDEH